MQRQNFRTVALVVGTLVYLLMGAAVFEAFEAGFEVEERDRLLDDQRLFQVKYNVSDEQFLRLTRVVMHSAPYKAGIQWKFAGSFFFSTTVITTIGYGHSTPKTIGGKVFCMFYALVGIPLNLVMFQSIGERLNIFVTFLLRRLLQRRRRRRRRQGTKAEAARGDVSQTHLIFISMNMSSLAVFGGAWAFSHYEDWTYLDSFYYCVITLTTVGFGDFVVLQQDTMLQTKPHYVVFSIVFILSGLAIVSAAMNLLVLRFLAMNNDGERDRALQETSGETTRSPDKTMTRGATDVTTVAASLSTLRGHQYNHLLLCSDEADLLSCQCLHCSCSSSSSCSGDIGRQRPRYRVTRSPVTRVTHLLSSRHSSSPVKYLPCHAIPPPPPHPPPPLPLVHDGGPLGGARGPSGGGGGGSAKGSAGARSLRYNNSSKRSSI